MIWDHNSNINFSVESVLRLWWVYLYSNNKKRSSRWMLYLIVWYAEIWCRESPGDITVNIKNFRFHHSFPVDYIVYWLGNPVRHKILNHIITRVCAYLHYILSRMLHGIISYYLGRPTLYRWFSTPNRLVHHGRWNLKLFLIHMRDLFMLHTKQRQINIYHHIYP